MNHKVHRYQSQDREQWNNFLEAAKNSTFLFNRHFMEYHSNRFFDYSIIASKEAQIMGVLPANLADSSTLISHQGLTFGGLVLKKEINLLTFLTLFREILLFLRGNGIDRLLLKRIPRFYTILPDDEIDYAFFLLGAKLYRRDTTFVVDQSNRLPFQKGRVSEISKSRRFGIQVEETSNFDIFWDQILVPRLESRYRVKPVHSLSEIKYLAAQFPQNIRQYLATMDGTAVAGATIFETQKVAHVQYSAVSSIGQETGALDCLFGWLLNERYKHKQFFNFGTANEQEGRSINLGLAAWKQGFGSKIFCHDHLEILTSEADRISSALPI